MKNIPIKTKLVIPNYYQPATKRLAILITLKMLNNNIFEAYSPKYLLRYRKSFVNSKYCSDWLKS